MFNAFGVGERSLKASYMPAQLSRPKGDRLPQVAAERQREPQDLATQSYDALAVR
jgi:hypothetical protein